MSLEREKANLQFLESGLQTLSPIFLETISKNPFLKNYNGSNQGLCY
jgi:hypothetical protein